MIVLFAMSLVSMDAPMMCLNRQMEMSTKFQIRDRDDVYSNYGLLLIRMASTVPDGMVVFFPSYLYLEQTISKWQEEGVLEKVLAHKMVYLETKVR